MREVGTQRLHCRPNLSSSFHEGLSAYAHRQAKVCLIMRETCAHAWHFVQQWVDLGVGMADGGEEVDENKLDGLLKIAPLSP